MLERALYEVYHIYPEQVLSIGDDKVVESEGEQYLLRKAKYPIIKKINEKRAMGDWLGYYGETDIASLLIRDDKREYIRVDDQKYLVFQLPKVKQALNSQGGDHVQLGKRLASFHQKGFGYTFQEAKKEQLNSWKERWEKRVDQLESWYVNISRSRNKTQIDEDFCLTFPYFLGVSENAIQMMADIFVDYSSDYYFQYRTICHQRFRESSWLTLDDGVVSRIKVPSEFTYDHFTRDIAEYIRTIWHENDEEEKASIEKINKFLNEYETVYRLSEIDQKLLLARLLFPVHYFEAIEQYYQPDSKLNKKIIGERCKRIFTDTVRNEQLILLLLQRYPQMKRSTSLPQWLTKGEPNTVFNES